MQIDREQLPPRESLPPQAWWDKFWTLSDDGLGIPRKEFLEAVEAHSSTLGKAIEGVTVVDIASGNGRYAIPFARMGFQTTAIEFTENGAERIRSIANEEQLPLTVLCGDFLALTPTPQDIVFASGFIEELQTHAAQVRAIELMQQWTKPGGLLICRYCIEISERGILITPEDLVPRAFTNEKWKIISKMQDLGMRPSIANISFENSLRTGTVVAQKI